MIAYIVLAAGKSTRMNSSTPKILFPLLGKALIEYVLDTLPAEDTFIVTNTPYKNYKCIPQKEARGTGDAITQALAYIPSQYTQCLIVCGDTPLLSKDTIAEVAASEAPLTIVTFDIKDLSLPYGRIVNNGKKIVEYKEASIEQRNIPTVYAGIMKAERSILEQTLPQLKPHPELYLTEILELTKVPRILISKAEEEFSGINTKADLASVERLIQKKLIHSLMLKGAIFYNPDTTSVYSDTVIEADAVIHPNVYIGPGVTIEEGAVIWPFSFLKGCHIKKGAQVGPFAHIHDQVVLGEKSVVGNFVEVKNSNVGMASKMKHLSYIGDSDIGDRVNIGAGVVTCNYDGFTKSKTRIEDASFIGSNSTLIAPMTVQSESYIGAGSVITSDVMTGDLSFTRPERRDIKEWVKKKRDKLKST